MLPRQPLQVYVADLREVGLPINHRGQLGYLCSLAGIQDERLYLIPIQREPRPVDVLDTHDIRPADRELRLGSKRLDGRLGLRWLRYNAFMGFMGQKGERHAEDIDVLRLEHVGSRVHIVGGPAQAPPDDLLTQQLAAEGTQSHDMRHRLGVPALGQHPDGNHVLDLLARFPDPADRIHLRAQ